MNLCSRPDDFEDLNREPAPERLEQAISTVLYTLKLKITLDTAGGYRIHGYPAMTEYEFVRFVRELEDLHYNDIGKRHIKALLRSMKTHTLNWRAALAGKGRLAMTRRTFLTGPRAASKAASSHTLQEPSPETSARGQ